LRFTDAADVGVTGNVNRSTVLYCAVVTGCSEMHLANVLSLKFPKNERKQPSCLHPDICFEKMEHHLAVLLLCFAVLCSIVLCCAGALAGNSKAQATVVEPQLTLPCPTTPVACMVVCSLRIAGSASAQKRRAACNLCLLHLPPGRCHSQHQGTLQVLR
jgi:hypothetical protein